MSQRYPLAQATGHRVLTALIRSQHLLNEERQGLHRAINALSMVSRFFIDPLQQALPRNHTLQLRISPLRKSLTEPLYLPRNSTPLDIIHLG